MPDAPATNRVSSENIRSLWTALRMVRDAIEEVGPVGALPSVEHEGVEPEQVAEHLAAAIAALEAEAERLRARVLDPADVKTLVHALGYLLKDDHYWRLHRKYKALGTRLIATLTDPTLRAAVSDAEKHVAALEAALAEARAEVETERAARKAVDIQYQMVKARRAAAESANERLRAALVKYGDPHRTCPYTGGGPGCERCSNHNHLCPDDRAFGWVHPSARAALGSTERGGTP